MNGDIRQVNAVEAAAAVRYIQQNNTPGKTDANTKLFQSYPTKQKPAKTIHRSIKVGYGGAGFAIHCGRFRLFRAKERGQAECQYRHQ